jgi:hypothetical protein
MALVDPTIALGFRQPEQPNLLGQYAAVQQIQSGQQANQLNQMKMQEYERARTEEEGLRNFLAQADLAKPETRAGLARYGKTGLAYGKALTEQDTAALTQRETAFKVQKAKGDFIAQAKRDTSNNPSDANLTAFKEDLLANPLFTEPEKTLLAANVDRILAMPVAQRQSFMASQGASASELKPVLTPQNLGGTARILSTPAFGGAATQVVGSEGTVTAAPPTPLNVSRLIKERDALLPGDPNIAIYNAAIRKETEFAPRAITNVNMPPQEKAEQGERGKMLVGEYSDISKAAKLAAKILPSIDANLSILDKGFSTGFGTETVAAGAKVLAALGVADADKFATNAQVFQAKATEAVLQKQLEQKGPQTESDAQRIDQIGAQLGKTTAGNKFVLTTAKEQLKRDMEQRNFYDKWWKTNKTYDGAEDAWYSGEGGKSLFDRPALKAYAKSAEAAAAPPAANRPSLDNIFAPKK